MAGNVRPIADERDGLLAFLAQQRDALRLAVQGLTEEQANATPTAGALSLAGLIKHAARTEWGWIADIMLQGAYPGPGMRDWETEFRLVEGETLAGMLDLYADVARETEARVAEIADLGQAVPVPKGVPWFPSDVENWSVRWVLFHLIEETARHAGHADIIRESIDGKSAYLIQAGFQE